MFVVWVRLALMARARQHGFYAKSLRDHLRRLATYVGVGRINQTPESFASFTAVT